MRIISPALLLVLAAAPAAAIELPTTTHWTHGRSQISMTESAGGRVVVTYNGASPSPAGPTMPAGTVLFEGSRVGDRIIGMAHTFKTGCLPVPYSVSGRIRLAGAGDGEIELAGPAPKRGPGCSVVGMTMASPHARLVFDNPDLRP